MRENYAHVPREECPFKRCRTQVPSFSCRARRNTSYVNRALLAFVNEGRIRISKPKTGEMNTSLHPVSVNLWLIAFAATCEYAPEGSPKGEGGGGLHRVMQKVMRRYSTRRTGLRASLQVQKWGKRRQTHVNFFFFYPDKRRRGGGVGYCSDQLPRPWVHTSRPLLQCRKFKLAPRVPI